MRVLDKNMYTLYIFLDRKISYYIYMHIADDITRNTLLIVFENCNSMIENYCIMSSFNKYCSKENNEFKTELRISK